MVRLSPSFHEVSLKWNPPLTPNGVITAYEVCYRPTDNSEPKTRANTTDLDTSFTTEDDLHLETEYSFSVRAYTRAGPGEISSRLISTLARPRKTAHKSMLYDIVCVCNHWPFPQLQSRVSR